MAGEDWPVGVVIHHIAEGHGHGCEWLSAMAAGTASPTPASDIDGRNAEHARRAETWVPTETIALLEENGDRFEACCGPSSDEHWTAPRRSARPAGRPSPPPTWPPVTASHAREHLATPAGPVRVSPEGARSVGVQRGADLLGRVGLGRARDVDAHAVHRPTKGAGGSVAGRDRKADVQADRADPAPPCCNASGSMPFTGLSIDFGAVDHERHAARVSPGAERIGNGEFVRPAEQRAPAVRSMASAARAKVKSGRAVQPVEGVAAEPVAQGADHAVGCRRPGVDVGRHAEATPQKRD